MLCDEFQSIKLAKLMSKNKIEKFCKKSETGEKKRVNILIGIISVLVVTFVCMSIGCFLRKRKKKSAFVAIGEEEEEKQDTSEEKLLGQDYLQIKEIIQNKDKIEYLHNIKRTSTFCAKAFFLGFLKKYRKFDFVTQFLRNGSTKIQSFVYHFVENFKLLYE